MPYPDWNERYATDDLPWDIGTPDPYLVEVVRTMAGRGRALEIGSGTGTNAIWLADQGFDVTALDLAPKAIERARAKLEDAPLLCKFIAGNFLTDDLPRDAFDLVFDRGCFHCFDEDHERIDFAKRVSAVLRSGGLWLSLCGSTEGPARDVGPPRRNLREITQAIEPALEIVEVKSVSFHAHNRLAAAWLCLSRKRLVGAQPSTRH